MITNAIDYYNELLKIKDVNKPQYAILLPTEEKIYDIDLNKRTTSAPDFLAVDTDHYAETIYFKVDRFYDNMDLASTVCVIQYINNNDKEDEGHIYLVPFYDIITYREEGKLLFPWQISNIVTKKAGTISFAIKFFKTMTMPGNPESQDPEEQKTRDVLVYNLNIQPSQSKVLIGLNLNTKDNDAFQVSASNLEILMERINLLSNMIGLYWIEDLSQFAELETNPILPEPLSKDDLT